MECERLPRATGELVYANNQIPLNFYLDFSFISMPLVKANYINKRNLIFIKHNYNFSY